MMILSKFDIKYVKHKSIKGQVIVDYLIDFPHQDDATLQIDFLDSFIMYFTKRNWKMFFDGSYTQNIVGSGILFITPHGYTIPKS